MAAPGGPPPTLGGILGVASILYLLGPMLATRDIRNLLQADPATRRPLVVPMSARPAEAARGLGADPVNAYAFPGHPVIPNDQLCDCDQWQFPNNPLASYGFVTAGLFIPQDHIVLRAGKNPNDGTRALNANPPIMGYPNNRAEWYNCRRQLHFANPAGVSCSECKFDCYDAARETTNDTWWRALCGPCHQKARLQYPTGYNSCTCEDLMVDKTCVPCADRVIDIWEVRNANIPWPQEETKRVRRAGTMLLRNLRDDADPTNNAVNVRKYETCPCGDFIDYVKAHNSYDAFLAGRDFDYDVLNFCNPAVAGQWSQFCTVCDGLIVPPAPKGVDPAPARPKLVFRRAMGIAGGADKVQDEWDRRNLPGRRRP